MKKTDLSKLKNLIREIETLQNELDRLKWEPKEQVVDYAKDYKTGYPRIITLTGYGDADYRRVKQKLTENLCRVQRERLRIEEQIQSVSDPEMRVILRLQYVNGMTQEQIAEEMGCSDRTIRNKLKRFWSEEK